MVQVALACQGGGSHAAYTAGVLKELLQRQETDSYEVIGLSGTSGGGLCALLAWWGLLDGGAVSAAALLDRFWHDNEPQSLWEELFNAGVVAGGNLPFEVKSSPYALSQAAIAALVEWMAPRRAFVDLRRLVGQHVPFDRISAICEFQKLNGNLAAWTCAYDQMGFAINPAPPIDRAAVRAALESVESATPNYCPLEESLGRVRASIRNGTDDALRQAIAAAAKAIPLLYLGAVNAMTGEFKAFSLREGEIDIDAALASACLPWIFPAVQGKYWDGLFSQNPPIRNFLADAEQRDDIPDEIWIVQINRQEWKPGYAGGDIADRRNQLAGNLSLNQEVESIETVNRRIFREQDAHPGHKPVRVHWIRMDVEALEKRWPMNVASKSDRSGAFIDALIAHGVEQARYFLEARRFIEEVWMQPDGSVRRWREGPGEVLEFLDHAYTSFPSCRFALDGMDLETRGENGSSRWAVFPWFLYGRRGIHVANLKGVAEIQISEGRIVAGKVRGVEALSVEGPARAAGVGQSPV
jgi:predicted acylesterase/phospholipase RssA